jgi:hypothetical protein
MKALMILCAALLTAGCATQSHKVPLTDGRWQQHNTLKQQACVLRIIEIAPATATKEDLDYNLKLCMMKNDLFI